MTRCTEAAIWATPVYTVHSFVWAIQDICLLFDARSSRQLETKVGWSHLSCDSCHVRPPSARLFSSNSQVAPGNFLRWEMKSDLKSGTISNYRPSPSFPDFHRPRCNLQTVRQRVEIIVWVSMPLDHPQRDHPRGREVHNPPRDKSLRSKKVIVLLRNLFPGNNTYHRTSAGFRGRSTQSKSLKTQC